MKKIYLFHETNNEYIYNIIDSKFILSSKTTQNKDQNPYDVYLPYIFMNCCVKEDIKYLSTYTFIFSYDILYERTFYINSSHGAGNLETSTYFPKNTNKKIIHNELYNLLQTSKKKCKDWKKFKFAAFSIDQEIFFRKKVDINEALYLVLPNNVDNNLLLKIKSNLPYIKIIFKLINKIY
jgi:hypothetical protein